MKNVILFGGSFNPPTISHQRILRACVSQAKQYNAEVWIMPSGQRKDKYISVSINRRKQYVEALKESVSSKYDIKIVFDEIDSEKPTETIDTSEMLKVRYPDIHFIWVFGVDSLQTMKDWREGSHLWNAISMLVVPRDGIILPELPVHATMLHIKMPFGLSSTFVRNKLSCGESVKEFVPASVFAVLSK